MPTLTTADALLNVAKGVSTAGIPQGCDTKEALVKLMEIFKTNATKYKDDSAESARKVLRDRASRKRVSTEEKSAPPDDEIEDKIEQEEAASPRNLQPTQQNEEQEAPPASRTRSKTTTRTLAQDLLLSTVEMSGSATRVMPRQAASRQYPLQFLCEYANAVLDSETDELLEYRHLMMRPQYKQVWDKSFGNEIGRLVQGMPGRVEGTNTVFFVHKSELPQDRFQDCTYGRVVCDVRGHKEEKHRTRLTVARRLWHTNSRFVDSKATVQ
jgi:hypothetical protein